ncbi:uncharacterized protein LOC144651663 [Oculina patagonica]
MADDSSKLKAEIAFWTNLIESHKHTAPTAPHVSSSGSHVSSMNNNTLNKNERSLSWQRSKQPEKEEKQSVSGPTHNLSGGQMGVKKSSYSLDRRKMTSSSSGSNTTTASMNATAIPGSSGLSWSAKDSKSISNNRTVSKQNELKLSATIPTATSKTAVLLPQAVSPQKSVNKTHNASFSQPNLNSTSRNPYVLNKKEAKAVFKQSDSKVPETTPKVSSSTVLLLPQAASPQKSVNATQNSSSSQPICRSTVSNPFVLNKKETFVKAVAQKSELKWSKPSVSSVLSSEDSKSLSDSELYTKKSSTSTGQLPKSFFTKVKSSATIHAKAPSMSNLQGSSYKWSKTKSTTSSSLSQKKSAKKSKLKWTKPGIPAQAGSKSKLNPYVLRKENVPSGSASQKQGVKFSKTASKSKAVKRPVYSAQNQSSHVWRSQSSLKLDRRKDQSNAEFVNKKALLRRTSASFIERRQRAVLRDSPVVTRYSVVRSTRKQAPIKAQKLNKVVVIGGVSYKTSSNKLTKAKTPTTVKESGRSMTSLSRKTIGKLTKTVNIQGEKFVMDSKGKTLQRISKTPRHASSSQLRSSKPSQIPFGRRRSSNGQRVILRTRTTLVRSRVSNTPSKTLASRVLQRSINNARLYKKNKKKPASEQYCMFYNRFGKCNKKDTCPYIHDPSKVAVCTKFLRGRCKNVDGSCPFSHKIDRDKMPVCQFFLRGKCSNDNCPYSHVNVSKKAEVCEDFLKGFCSRGQQCNKKHILECEEFSMTGKCSKGSKCKLMHRARKPASERKRKSTSKEENESLKVSKLDFTSDEGFLPLTASTSDLEQTFAQDPLENTPEETKEMAAEPVVIRPRFLKPKEPEK